MTFKEWRLRCEGCTQDTKAFHWDHEFPLTCTNCGHDVWPFTEAKLGKAPGVIGDELHNYYARHAVCNPDGSPRRFDSKTELKRALNEAGWTIAGDTPRPYDVPWSGRRKDPEPVAPLPTNATPTQS